MNFLAALHSGGRFIDDGGGARRPVHAALIVRVVRETKPTIVSLAVLLWAQLAQRLNEASLDARDVTAVRLQPVLQPLRWLTLSPHVAVELAHTSYHLMRQLHPLPTHRNAVVHSLIQFRLPLGAVQRCHRLCQAVC